MKAGLKILKKGHGDIPRTSKSEEWKIALAAFLKARSSVSNGGLCKNLKVGSPGYASTNITIYNRERRNRCGFFKLLIEKSKA